MKILRIRGKNIASLEKEFCIDFTKAPLLHADLFAICGRTGAGKSTILDVICLALFKTTPRLKVDVSNAYVDDANNEMIRQQDPRTLLRRGAKDGFAEVDFKGIDKKEYKARWEVSRAYSRIDKALKNYEISLMCLDNGEILTEKRNEFDTLIEEKLGLSFEQFKRSVLLAQGEFANFLKSKDAEKAEILEKITGTDIYSELSRKIYERAKNDQMAKENLRQQMDDVTLLSDEEKTKLSDEIRTLSQEIDQLSVRINKLNNHNIHECGILSQQQHHSEAKSIKEQAEKEYNDSQVRHKQLVIKKKVANISKSFQDLKQERNDRDVKEKRLTKYIEELKGKEKVLKSEETTKTKIINQLEQLIKEYNEKKPNIEKAKSIFFDIEQKKRLFREQKEEQQSQIEEKQKYIEKCQECERQKRELLKDIEATEIRIEDQNYLETIDRHWSLLTDKWDTYDRLKRSQKKDLNTLRLKRDDLKHLDSFLIPNLEQKIADLESIVSSEIIKLRKRLIDGEPCPVCGSIHHQVVNIEADSGLSEEKIEDQKEQYKKELQEHRTTSEKLKNNIVHLEKEIERQKDECKTIEKDIDKIVSNVKFANDVDIYSKEFEALLSEKLKQWKDAVNQLKQLNDKNKLLEKDLDLLSGKIPELQRSIELGKKKGDQLIKSIRDLEAELQTLCNGENPTLIENTLQKELDKQRTISQDIEASVQKLKSEGDALNSSISEQKQSLNELNLRIEKEETFLREWQERNELSNEEIKAYSVLSQEELEKEEKDLNRIKDRLIATEAALKEADKALAKQVHDRTLYLPDEKDMIDLYGDSQQILFDKEKAKSKIEELEQKKNDLDKSFNIKAFNLKTDQENELKQKSMRHKLDKLEKKSKVSSQLSDLFGSASGDKFRLIAQRYTLDALLEASNYHLKNFTSRYTLCKLKNSLALAVIDHEMMDECRSVLSLSGGETFIVSLSLALGLSTLSSERIHIESMFIDEGFGSLDKNVLNQALEALQLLSAQGRKLGIISHVAELNELIPVQVQVQKKENGKSEIHVVG